MTNVQKIQAVINTLEIMEIRPSYDNSNRLYGIYTTLLDVLNDLARQEAEQEQEQNTAEVTENDGDAGVSDAE